MNDLPRLIEKEYLIEDIELDFFFSNSLNVLKIIFFIILELKIRSIDYTISFLAIRTNSLHVSRLNTTKMMLTTLFPMTLLQTPTMWFRLYENAYPQALILGDRQLIDDQRFMLRTQNNDRDLEIFGARKDDQGYYICKTGNTVQSSYNLTIASIKFHLKWKEEEYYLIILSS